MTKESESGVHVLRTSRGARDIVEDAFEHFLHEPTWDDNADMHDDYPYGDPESEADYSAICS